jgi:hypothetical protein
MMENLLVMILAVVCVYVKPVCHLLSVMMEYCAQMNQCLVIVVLLLLSIVIPTILTSVKLVFALLPLDAHTPTSLAKNLMNVLIMFATQTRDYLVMQLLSGYLMFVKSFIVLLTIPLSLKTNVLILHVQLHHVIRHLELVHQLQNLYQPMTSV